VELWMIQHDSESRHERVCKRLFEHDLDRAAEYSSLFLQSLSQIFSRLGEAYVRVLKGESRMSDFVGPSTIEGIVRQVADRKPPATLKHLHTALLVFFAEDDPDFTAIKWNFAQNYYLARALGMDSSGSLLSQEAFADAVFYLDTNVIIPAIEPRAGGHTSARVLLCACKQLNIELRACQISLDQLKNVTQHNVSILPLVTPQVPDEIIPRMRSVFFKLYYDALQQPGPVDFGALFGRFYSASEYLGAIGVDLCDDAWFTELGSSPEILDLVDALNASLAARHRKPKWKASAIHDVSLLRWVEKERQNGRANSWLVTLDSSLSDTSWVTTSPRPLAITLDALLQWISPMAASACGDFEDSYAMAIKNLLLPQETFFDTRDFLIFAELDWSCRELPAKDVENCILSIKTNLPLVDPTTAQGRELLAHHISKFFADPGREFKQEIERLEEERQQADLAHKQQLSEAEGAWVSEITGKEKEIADVRDELERAKQSTEQRIASLEEQLKAAMDDLRAERSAAAERAQRAELRRSAKLRVLLCAGLALALEAVVLLCVLRYGEGGTTFVRVSKNLAILGLPQAPMLLLSLFIVGKERLAALGWPFDKFLK